METSVHTCCVMLLKFGCVVSGNGMSEMLIVLFCNEALCTDVCITLLVVVGSVSVTIMLSDVWFV